MTEDSRPLDALNQSKGKRVIISLKDGDQITGVLKAFDLHINLWLENAEKINNWDLVDVSAPKIVGGWLLGRPNERKILHQLAKSKSLWERRITILSTLAFIREKQFEDTLKIAEILLNDNHNLIHKTVGWMLREIGKRNQAVEENFLKKHHQKMPRTMLRYAIERLPEKKRKWYLKR